MSLYRFFLRNLWSIAVFSVALATGLIFYNRGLAVADDGNMVMAALRVLDGQVPYRDFVHFFYSPGSVYLLSLLYAVFGESYLILRATWMMAQSLSVLLIFVISSKHVSKPLALLPAAVALLMPGPWFKALYPFFSLLTFWTISRYLECPSRRRACELGGLCAFALFFRQDIGIWASLLSFVTVALTRFFPRHKPFRELLMDEFCLVGTSAALLLPFLTYMWTQDALQPMLTGLLVETPTLTGSNLPSSLRILALNWSRDRVLFLIFSFHYIFPFIAFFLLRLVDSPLRRKQIGVLLVLNVLALLPALTSISLIRVMQSNYLNTLLFVVFMSKIASTTRTHQGRWLAVPHIREAAIIIIYTLMLALPVLYVYDMYSTRGRRSSQPLYTGNFLTMLNQNIPFDIQGERIYLSDRVHRNASKVLNTLPLHTQPEDSVIFLPAKSIFNYFSGHPNPTKFIGIWTQLYHNTTLSNDIESRFISEIEKHRIDFIVFYGEHPQRTSKSKMNSYLNENYTLILRKPIFILKRRDTKKLP